MSAYRFCRTDDIPLLVDALNRCWSPYFPDEPAMTVARFKREIRELQVWCSSCMVAFAGADPIAVMVGAKRSGATLVHRIAVHPDHVRQGHGRHLLTSLSSKLSILGPPRIVVELPATAAAAHHLFAACGFSRENCYTDFVLDRGGRATSKADDDRLSAAAAASLVPQVLPGRLVIPVTVDDLAANGLLDRSDTAVCWERSIETITARAGEIAGLAVATDERIEAYLLYVAAADADGAAQILVLRSDVGDAEGVRVRSLLDAVIARRPGPVRISKVHRDEIPPPVLHVLGFQPDRVHIRYAATARPS